MKLYNVPKNTKIKIIDDEEGTVFNFHHIDGMYSYCERASDNSVCHLAAWTEVEIVNENNDASMGRPYQTLP
jgi:hypothetical protein